MKEDAQSMRLSTCASEIAEYMHHVSPLQGFSLLPTYQFGGTKAWPYRQFPMLSYAFADLSVLGALNSEQMQSDANC